MDMPMHVVYTVVLGLVIAFANSASAQNNPKLDALTGGDVALGKMSSDLLAARRDATAGTPAPTAMRNHASHAIRNEKAQVVIGVSALTPELLAALSAARLDLVTTFSQFGVSNISVLVADPRHLDVIARREDVRSMAFEPQATTRANAPNLQRNRGITSQQKLLVPRGTVAPR